MSPPDHPREPSVGLDEKQERIITSWLARATDPGFDSYARFIALWIAFNAYCYAHYAIGANRQRADLRKDHGLDDITPERAPIAGSIHCKNATIMLDIER